MHPKIFLKLIPIFLLIISCNKNKPDCFDRKMYKSHNGICLMDCPGVLGCDGEIYCNECVANSQGITVVE